MNDEKKPVDIKTKRKEKQMKIAKPKKAEFYKAISNAINRDLFELLPEFPKRFFTMSMNSGVKLPLIETAPGVVKITELEMVVYAIIEYCHNYLTPEGKDCFCFTVKEAKEAAQFWLAHTPPIPQPKMVTWVGEEGYTFHRLPWERVGGETPVFDEMMSRTTNSDALMAFIGSLFFEKADTQQYLWVHGQGQNGKSALTRFLKDALGSAYRALVIPKGEGRFWTSNLLGCRLGVFADTNDTKWITSGLGKTLTGGDPVAFEIKGGAYGTADLACKFIFLSNSRPAIASEKADLRRLILCEMTAINGEPDSNYHKKLWDEGGYFLNKCIHKYGLMCPNNKQIPISNEADIRDWVSTVEETFETFFLDSFILEEKAYTIPGQMQKKLYEKWRDNQTHGKFLEWLERSHGIRKKTENSLPGTPKLYRGIKIIPHTDVVKKSEFMTKAGDKDVTRAYDR